MFEENMNGVTPIKRLTSEDISGPLGTIESINPETGLTGDSKSARRLTSKELSEGFMVDVGGISPIISHTPGGIRRQERILGEEQYHPELGPTHNALLMHERQSVGGMFANFVGQVGAEIVGGTIEGIGYLSDLASGTRLATDSQAEFGNSIAEFGASIKEGSREILPIHTDPYKEGAFDPGSWAWWMSNGVSVASTISLMIPSMAATRATMLAAQIAKIAPKAGTAAQVGIQGVTQAIYSRHAESMMEAAGVYKENYQRALDSGMSETDAKKVASAAASNSYNKQWALLVQDIPQYILLNKLGALKKSGVSKDTPSEIANFLGKNRLATTAGKTGAVAMDMAGEGFEEFYQFLVNEQSNLIANKMAYPDRDIEHSLIDVLKDNYDDGEMWTSGFFGAIGAGVMQAGFAGMNYKAMQNSVKEQMKTVTDYGIGLNQSMAELKEAMNSGDPLKVAQALPAFIASTTMRDLKTGTTKYTDHMLSELEKGVSPELAEKWGISIEAQEELKNNPALIKQLREGRQRIAQLYERFIKENDKNPKIKPNDKEPNAQVMANSEYLAESTENMMADLESRKDEAWSKIEKIEKVSPSGQRGMIEGARLRAQKKILERDEKKLKDNEATLKPVEKELLVSAIADTKLEIAKLENLIKGITAERKKEKIVDPEDGVEKSVIEYDKQFVLPEDQIDAFRSESLRVAAAKDSIKQLRGYLTKLRDGKNVVDIKKEAVQEALNIDTSKPDEDTIEFGDSVRYLDEQTGKPVVGIVDAIEVNEDGKTDEKAETKYVITPINEETGQPIEGAAPVTKPGLDLRLESKLNNEFENEITADPLEEAEQRLLDREGMIADESEENPDKMHPISNISYSQESNGTFTSRNTAFSNIISSKLTDLSGATANYFLDNKTEKGRQNLRQFSGRLTDAQKPIFEKFINNKKLTTKEIDTLVESIAGVKYDSFADRVPISIDVKIGTTVYSGGIFLHRSDFPYIKIPKSVRIKGEAAIEKYKQDAYKRTSKNRTDLLRKLLSGKVLYSKGLNRSRGKVRVAEAGAKDRNRNLTKVLNKKASEINIAIAHSTKNSPHQADLKTAKDNFIPGSEKSIVNSGNVYALLSGDETLNGDPYALKLNRPFLSVEHADILFDAFVLVGRTRITTKGRDGKPINPKLVQFLKEDPRVQGITAGEVIDLLVNNGKEMTEPNTLRFKERNTKKGQAELMANKRLYISHMGKNVVLLYGHDSKTGRPFTVDLTKPRGPEMDYEKTQFIKWAIANKRYAIYLESKKLGLKMNGDFLNTKSFRIGTGENAIVREGAKYNKAGKLVKPAESYKEFIIRNQLVETDAIRDKEGNMFRDPVVSLNITDTNGGINWNRVREKGGRVQPAVPEDIEESVVNEKPAAEVVDTEDTFNKEPDQVEREKSGSKTKGVTYKNPFTTKKNQAVFINGIESENPGTEILDITNEIEKLIEGQSSKDETISAIKAFLSERSIKVSSKGVAANKSIIAYIEARFNGNTTNTLYQEWNAIADIGSDVTSEDNAVPADTLNESQAEETDFSPEETEDDIKTADDLNSIFDLSSGEAPQGKQSTEGKYIPYNEKTLQDDIEWAYDIIGIDKSEFKIREKLADLIYNGKTHFALYSQSAIMVYSGAERGSIYHEAFHRVSLGYFTTNERAKMYRAARNIYNLTTDKYTDKQVEELLAEKFELFVITKGKVKPPSAIQAFFQPLLDFIERVFFGRNKLGENDIERIFYKIRRGDYRKSEVRLENKNLLKLGEYQKTMIGENQFNSLDTRADVKSLINGLTEHLLDVNKIAYLSEIKTVKNVTTLKHAPLISRINQWIRELDSRAMNESLPDAVRIRAGNLRELYKEVLGPINEKGLYENYSSIIVPQIDGVLASMGVRQHGMNYLNSEFIVDEETENGKNLNDVPTDNVGKIGGNYFKAEYERSKRETALANIKFMIYTLHKDSYIDPETNQVKWAKNATTGMSEFVNFGAVWSKLFNAIYWINNVEDMIAELRVIANEENYIPFYELADRLDNASEEIRNEFFITVRSKKLEFINWDARRTDQGFKFFINDSAKNEAAFGEIAVWNEMFFNDENITFDKRDKDNQWRKYFKKSFFKEVEQLYTDLTDGIIESNENKDDLKPSKQNAFIKKETAKHIKSVLNILNKFNITVGEEVIRHMMSKQTGENLQTDLDRLYSYATDSLQQIFTSSSRYKIDLKESAEEGKEIDRSTMALFKNRAVIQLAEALIAVHPELISDSQLGPDKNIYSTFSSNDHISETVNRLNNDPEYVATKATLINNKKSRILQDMIADPTRMEKFGLVTYSYLRVEDGGSNDKGRGYMDITELEDYLIKFNSIFNTDKDGNEDPMLPLPAQPRQTYYFIKGVRKFARTMVGYKDGNVLFSEEVLNYFYDQYIDELERINYAIETRDKYLAAKGEEKESLKMELQQNYHYVGDHIDVTKGNAYNFIHFEGFEVNKTSKKPQPKLAKSAFNSRISVVLNNQIKAELDYALSIQAIGRDFETGEYSSGLLDTVNMDEYSTAYGDSINMGVIGVISDFVMNTSMAVIESEKTLLTDPAFFIKNKTTGEVWEDVYKRWYGAGSTGVNYVETIKEDPVNYYSVLMLNNHRISMKESIYDTLYDKHVELWKKHLKKYNKDIDEVKLQEDAEKLAKTRLSEYKNFDPTDGQAWISPTMFKHMLKRSHGWNANVEKAFNALNSDQELTPQQEIEMMHIVLNPQKTVYMGDQIKNGLSVLVYDKMSMAILFKRLVNNTHLENLYNRMEAKGQYSELDKIHVVNFNSVTKIGGRPGYTLFKDLSTRNETNDLSGVVTSQQYWKHLRKQVTTDANDDFTVQAMGSAVFKIGSANINKSESYGDFETGMDLLNGLTASRVAVSNVGRHKVNAALGVQNGKISNVNLVRMLISDARKAKKSDDFIRALKVDPISGRKYLEIDAFPDRRWLYSRLMKLVTDNTIDLVTPGAQLIQTTDFGFKNINYDNELKFSLLEKGEDTVSQMESRVSIRVFKHLIPNYAKLTHKERVAAIAHLDIPLIGYRTPTQGQNSIFSLKIVEFLPDEAGDVIRLPLEFTALTGSDYDIDKLFAMFHNYRPGKGGKTQKVEFSTDLSKVEERYDSKIEELYRIYKNDDTVFTTTVFDKLIKGGEVIPTYISDQEYNHITSLINEENVVDIHDARERHTVLFKEYQSAQDKGVKEVIYDKLLLEQEIIDSILTGNKLESIKEKRAFEVKKDTLLKAGRLPSLEAFKKLSIEEQNTSEANQNRIIDILHTVIRDEKHYLSTSQPLGGVTNQLKELSSFVERAENGGEIIKLGPLGSTTPRYQSQAKFRFLTSSKGVGPFALANSHHALTQMAALKMKTGVKYGMKEQQSGTVPLDLSIGRDNVYITDWLSGMIDAHVDALKDNYISKLNINNATYTTVSLMLRLGFGLQTFKFISQPILKEYTRVFFNLGGRIKDEDDIDDNKNIADKAFRIIYRKYKSELGYDSDESISLKNDDLIRSLPDLMAYYDKPSNLRDELNPNSKKDRERNIRQLNVLIHFWHMFADAEDLNKLVIESRIDTKKLGATPSEQMFSRKKLMDLEEEGKFPGLRRLLNSDGEYVQNGTMLSPMLNNSVFFLEELLRDTTVYGTKGFDDIFWRIVNSMPNNSSVRISTVNNIVEEMFSFFVGDFFGDPNGKVGITKERLEAILFKGNKTIFNLISKMRKADYPYYEELKNNKFFEHIRVDSKPNMPIETYIRTLFTSTANKLENDDFIEDFLLLFNHESAEIRDLAKKLYIYAYYTTGYRHKFRSFLKYIPSSVQRELQILGPDKEHPGKLKAGVASLNNFIYDLIRELNDGNTGLVKYSNRAFREILENNWFNRWWVPQVQEKDEYDIIEDSEGNEQGIELKTASRFILGSNDHKDIIYASHILIKGVGEYQSSRKAREQSAGEVDIEALAAAGMLDESMLDDIVGREITWGLLEFVGLNTETQNPIYMLKNKKGFSSRGNIFREYGIRNEESIIPENNLVNKLTSEEKIKLLEEKIKGFRSIPIDMQVVIEKDVSRTAAGIGAEDEMLAFIEQMRAEEAAKHDIRKKNTDVKSDEDSYSSYERPIEVFVDGSVLTQEDGYGYGVYSNIDGKPLEISGTKEDVDREFFSKFPEVKEQNQFSPSMELLGLVTALKQFENTAEHIVIRQDNDGSINYEGLRDRAEDDPHRQATPWKPNKKHIKSLVNEAVSLIEKIESNGGSVRIYYVPAHNNKAKWADYLLKYRDQKKHRFTEAQVTNAKNGNNSADMLARNTNSKNTFTRFIKQLEIATPVGLKPGLERTEEEENKGKENNKNCKNG